jgi:hypothetical protein
MSTQSQNPNTGQQDQKQRNPGQDRDKYAREDDKAGAKKDKDAMVNEGAQSGDDDEEEGGGNLNKR